MGTATASIQLTIANVAEHAGGGVGGNPQWGGQFNLTGPHADLAVPHLDVDDLFVIDPRFQFFLGDAQLDGVPAVFLENVDVAGFVLGGVEIVDAGYPDEGSTPTAQYERGVGIVVGEGESAEEITALGSLALQVDFVV